MSAVRESSDDLKKHACQTSWNALERDDPQTAAEALRPFAEETASDEELAQVWIAMLGSLEDLAHLEREVRRLARYWAATSPIVLETCRSIRRAWGRQAGPLPPAPRDSLIGLGVDLLDHCLEEAPPPDPEERASLFIERALLLSWAGPLGDERLLSDLEIALTLCPDRWEAWFCLVRAHLSRGRWSKAALACEEALRTGAPPQKIGWNLAVALTGCAPSSPEGVRSLREAWRMSGHEELAEEGISDRQGRVMGGGYERQLVALNAHMVAIGGGWDSQQEWSLEVVWVQPLSPCHGRILHGTARTFPADFDDLIIWDPQPVRFTVFEGEERPVMGAIAILERGDALSRPLPRPRLTHKQLTQLNRALPQGVIFHQPEDGSSSTGKLSWPRGEPAFRVAQAFNQIWDMLSLPTPSKE